MNRHLTKAHPNLTKNDQEKVRLWIAKRKRVEGVEDSDFETEEEEEVAPPPAKKKKVLEEDEEGGRHRRECFHCPGSNLSNITVHFQERHPLVWNGPKVQYLAQLAKVCLLFTILF